MQEMFINGVKATYCQGPISQESTSGEIISIRTIYPLLPTLNETDSTHIKMKEQYVVNMVL